MGGYTPAMRLPFQPPLEPMLAKAAAALPEGEGWLYEPKWDGFRAIVFRDGDEILTQSRDLKPLDRYFPELAEPLRAALPERCVVDGEIVIARDGALDFEALLLRIHPAESRVRLLAGGDAGVVRRLGPAGARRRGPAGRPAGRAPRAAGDGPGRRRATGPSHPGDGRSSASPPTGSSGSRAPGWTGSWPSGWTRAYQPGKRAMLKVKHARTADCVVAGFRWHKNGPGTHVGSLLLGLYRRRRPAPPRRRHLVVHLGAAGRAGRRAGAAARAARSTTIRGRSGPSGPAPAPPTHRGSACRVRRAAGTGERTSPGSRSGSSGSARSPTITSRATASATPPRSGAGGPTSRRATAATTSWR